IVFPDCHDGGLFGGESSRLAPKPGRSNHAPTVCTQCPDHVTIWSVLVRPSTTKAKERPSALISARSVRLLSAMHAFIRGIDTRSGSRYPAAGTGFQAATARAQVPARERIFAALLGRSGRLPHAGQARSRDASRGLRDRGSVDFHILHPLSAGTQSAVSRSELDRLAAPRLRVHDALRRL